MKNWTWQFVNFNLWQGTCRNCISYTQIDLIRNKFKILFKQIDDKLDLAICKSYPLAR